MSRSPANRESQLYAQPSLSQGAVILTPSAAKRKDLWLPLGDSNWYNFRIVHKPPGASLFVVSTSPVRSVLALKSTERYLGRRWSGVNDGFGVEPKH